QYRASPTNCLTRAGGKSIRSVKSNGRHADSKHSPQGVPQAEGRGVARPASGETAESYAFCFSVQRPGADWQLGGKVSISTISETLRRKDCPHAGRKV